MTAAFALLRPFALLAVVAFAAGFLGHWALGQPIRAIARTEIQPAAASAPASDDWNLPRHI